MTSLAAKPPTDYKAMFGPPVKSGHAAQSVEPGAMIDFTVTPSTGYAIDKAEP
ncbi:hypothetical protein VU07_01495 [Desulfobulbus sp. F4]|nr:hypothetical protein [Desulfobulbus sp. F4]